ncbi:MAG: hypothetical protein DDT42_01559 [candidate division WS2 bacterium]|uniref:DUF86 domain-containing protein n=1 Tax=Psychracetigena formicireducens TaxID=2986056 RepID=A0A9E2BIG1_PSYF1|nr:hypothetical protein [Candidatus Psychracetigena formicireducens]
MRKADVQSKLEIIPENIEKLELLRAKDYQEFRSDFRNIDSTLHRLQTSIQSLIDIGSYIIAQLGLKTPSFSAEVIEILAQAEFISPEDQERYITMIQFRNRVVHLYNSVDVEVLFGILQEEINDIRMLYRTFLEIIEAHESRHKKEERE